MTTRMGRKGTSLDMIFITVLLVVFAVMILVSTYLADKIFSPLQDAFVDDDKAVGIIQTAKGGYTALDNIFMFLYFMLNLTPVVFAVFVRHHPIFLIINILVLLVFLLLAPTMSNVVLELWGNDEFAQYSYGGGGFITYGVMTRVFQYLPIISVGLSILLMVAMFVKSPSSGSTF